MPQISSSTAPNGLPSTASRSRARAPRRSSSRSTPARARSARRRTAWRTSSSTSCSRAARSTTTTARSTRRPSGWAASLNAYTSHDLVAFHITVRAEAAMEAHRPAHRLRRPPEDRRRRARPRARRRHPGDPALQGPAVGRRRGAHRPRGVRRPPARAAPCSAPRSTCARFTREGIVAFRERRWSGQRGGAFIVGNLDHVPDERRRGRAASAASPTLPAPGALRARPAASDRTPRRAARHEPVAPADDATARTSTSPTRAQRAAFTIYSTLLGGSMGSRLFDEIREQRGLCYSV